MVPIHAYEFIIRRHHYSGIFSVCHSNVFTLFYSCHQFIPILLPVFHRVNFHNKISKMQVGMIGFEPTATRSQSECSTKLSYIPVMDLI